MHYKVDDIYVRDGTVYMHCTESGTDEWGTYPIYDHESMSTFAQCAETGRGLFDGSFQFTKPSSSSAKKVYEHCKKRHGDYWSHRNEKDWRKYRERFASEFARRMCA